MKALLALILCCGCAAHAQEVYSKAPTMHANDNVIEGNPAALGAQLPQYDTQSMGDVFPYITTNSGPEWHTTIPDTLIIGPGVAMDYKHHYSFIMGTKDTPVPQKDCLLIDDLKHIPDGPEWDYVRALIVNWNPDHEKFLYASDLDKHCHRAPGTTEHFIDQAFSKVEF